MVKSSESFTVTRPNPYLRQEESRMPLELNKIQNYERIKGTMQSRLKEINPVLRVKQGRDEPPLYIQKGKVYTEGDPNPIPQSELPPWFWDQMERVSEKVKVEVGWHKPSQKATENPKATVLRKPKPRGRPRKVVKN